MLLCCGCLHFVPGVRCLTAMRRQLLCSQEGQLQSDMGYPCALCCGTRHPLKTPPNLHMPQPFTEPPAPFHQRQLKNTGC